MVEYWFSISEGLREERGEGVFKYNSYKGYKRSFYDGFRDIRENMVVGDMVRI